MTNLLALWGFITIEAYPISCVCVSQMGFSCKNKFSMVRIPHYDCERMCRDLTWLAMCVEKEFKCGQRQSVVSNADVQTLEFV